MGGAENNLRQLIDLRRQFAMQKDALNLEEELDRAKNLQSSLDQYRFTVREYAHQHSESEPGVRAISPKRCTGIPC